MTINIHSEFTTIVCVPLVLLLFLNLKPLENGGTNAEIVLKTPKIQVFLPKISQKKGVGDFYAQNHTGLSAKTTENEADIIGAICLKNRSRGGEGKFPEHPKNK